MLKKIVQVFPECEITMSDLFINVQRRRWQHDAQQRPQGADANAPIKRSTRAATPGPISGASTFGQKTKSYDIPHINSGDQSHDKNEKDQTDSAADEDPFANVLSLKLRKPKHWKWELTTSKSCTNIALPRILLYDHKGNLLVDAPPGGNSSHEQVYKQEDFERSKSTDRTKKRSYTSHRSATTNLTHSVRKALEKEFDGLQIQEVCSGQASRTTPSTTSTNTTMRSRRSRKPIELSTKDLSDLSRRSSSAKGVRFHVDREYEATIPDFLPTPPSTTTPTSSSSGPREKRKYRRSHSSGRSSSRSLSILERFSYQKGRFSSPESEDERLTDNQPGPRYFLRTDEAGTLLVHQDSSSSSLNPRRRRKPQKYQTSSESVNKTPESQNSSALAPSPAPSPAPTPALQDSPNSPNAPSEASTTASNRERRRKILPIRRHLTEGDIFADKRLSTSEEEEAPVVKEKERKEKADVIPPCATLGAGCSCRQQRKYKRNETRGELVITEVPRIYGDY